MPASSNFFCEASALKTTGNDHLASEDYTLAIAAYTKAVTILNQNPECDSQRPTLRAILLSNRSHAHLLSKHPDKALEDADSCVKIEPKWPKAHLRRANALRKTRHRKQKQEALDAYDDAIAVAKNDNSNSKSLISELKASRKQCELELRETGSCHLSKEVSDMGCMLAVPGDATIAERCCFGAALKPAAYDGVDDRTNTPIHAVFPGDPCWPVFAPTLSHNTEPSRTLFPVHYYIIGSCFLTKACAKEFEDIFKPKKKHACRWPDGKATRTCPFCASACVPGENERITMVTHMLIGRANDSMNLAAKMMMQLVCARCTRKRIRKATCPNKEDFAGTNIDPLQRLRILTDGSHAIKASVLWNRAANTGLISSITISAQSKFKSDAPVRHNSGSKSTPVESSGQGSFFNTWMSQPDNFELYGEQENPDKKYNLGAPATNQGHSLSVQEFHIRQVAIIKDRRKALGRFWKKFGAAFRLKWSDWDVEMRKAFARTFADQWFEARMEHYGRRATQYNKIEDPRRLVNKPYGKVPKTALSFLPEVTGSVFGDDRYDLLELFQKRASSETCIAEDVSLIAKLKKQNRLPKLFYNESDRSYLCDYMGMEDSTIGPFVVLVGERDPEYNVDGTFHGNPLMNPKAVVKLPEYHSLQQPFLEKIKIYQAFAPGEVRTGLENLLNSGVATDAVCYIYAAMRQEMLLAYLQEMAECFYEAYGGNDRKEVDKWSYAASAGCYVCNARTCPDGSKLLCCSLCQKVNYCSKKCQKLDWKRHKAESCIRAT